MKEGKRIWFGPHRLKSGEYGEWKGVWYCCTPNGLLGNLGAHEVIEHEDDGTITVSPSILVTCGTDDDNRWHGYLKRGVWNEC